MGRFWIFVYLCRQKSKTQEVETVEHNPEAIGPKFIDIERILAAKGVKVPRIARHWLGRLLHVKELNAGIYNNRHLFGIPFAQKFIEGREPYNLGITIETRGMENIPAAGNQMIVGNHPLGGPDGVALMTAVGCVRQDIKFPVNDFLCYLPGLKELFVPIDKVNRTKALAQLEDAFASEYMLLYYPAGMCSRLQKGEIKDLDWKATFIKKCIQYHRDVVPAYTEARNRMSFYRIANLRKRLGVKFNFEMALLPAEMFAQRGKTLTITFGQPIPWQTFDKRHTAAEWAAMVKEHVYRLKDNPEAVFSV